MYRDWRHSTNSPVGPYLHRSIDFSQKSPTGIVQARNFIVSQGIIKGKGLQFPGTNFVDKTLKSPESTYKITFLVLSRIWYTICTRAWSPFNVIIPWKTMKVAGKVEGFGIRVSGFGFRDSGSGFRV